jgi:hypothetical protein
MAKKKDPEQIKREQLGKESMEIVLKRSGVPKSKIIEYAMRMFYIRNIDLLTPEERRKYKSVIL